VSTSTHRCRTKKPLRTIPVYTETGRKLLTRAYLNCRDTEQTLEEEILAAHALLDDEVGAVA